MDLNNRSQVDVDFSGMDLDGYILDGYDFHESVFNGAYFTNVKFINCNLSHTEYTESKFTSCTFINCNLNYSDFVYAQIEDVIFENCLFAHVEWRESKYNRATFISADFKNSTVSLCSFCETSFDSVSASNFCGVSKRFNVFSRTKFVLPEGNLDFLKCNYGIILDNSSVEYYVKKEDDSLLLLSALKYTGNINTEKFIDLIISSLSSLIADRQKNQVQKIKYLSLIVKNTLEEKMLSIFAQHFLIQSLNALGKEITDSSIFMELVELIMSLKTNQYKEIKLIESTLEPYQLTFVDSLVCEFTLENQYTRNDVEVYSQLMSSYLNIAPGDIVISSFRNGSTIFELIIKGSLSIGGFLIFINFSLSQISKTFQHISKIKKDIKYIVGKKDEVKNNTPVSETLLAPISIMINEGNDNYYQINNMVSRYGKGVTTIDGKGKINMILDNTATLTSRV